MKITVINSGQDPAGVNIRRHLLRLLDNGGAGPIECGSRRYTFMEVEGRLIYERGIEERVDADLIIFISRHTSVDPVPALTVHVTGNFQEAVYGGEPRMLARSAPAWMHAILRALAEHAPQGYRVSYEVTHHGPTDLDTPSLFVEIGSTITEWEDEAAGLAVARSILAAEPATTLNLIGFGGNHYAARQTAIALETAGAFGHIAHSRDVPALDRELIEAMRSKTGAVAAYIDRKALKKEELRSLEWLLDEIELPRLTESEIHQCERIGWESYRIMREIVAGTAPGSRIHLHRMEGAGTPAAFSIPGDLLEETLRADEKAFLDRLDELPIAHLSSPKGPVLPIFISYEKNRSTLIHDLISSCIDILMRNAPAAVRDDSLIIKKIRFDPQKARNLRIPKGPLFGRLASGRAIEIDGKTITPDMVSISSEKVIHIPGLERYL